MVRRVDQALQMQAAFESIDSEGEAPLKRRSLRRILAVGVAIAAISPLFAADPNGCARGSVHTRPFHQNLPSPTPDLHHH
jgi:hypothetical protein